MFDAQAQHLLQPIELSDLGDRPLVSVLMANYNYAAFIGDAIASVRNQTYTDWELIVCDDGSTDDSVRIVEALARADSRIRLITKPNGGHASALNAAYAACTGRIVCFLDSDDLFLPTKIEQVVMPLRFNTDSGMVLHRVTRVNKNRRKQGIWPLIACLPQGWCAQRVLAEGGVLPYLPPTCGLSLRREIADRIFPIPSKRPLHYAPDQVITRIAPLLTKLTSIDDSLAEYRLHGKNSFEGRINADAVNRDILVNEQLWQVQHAFLERYCPSSVESLKPFKNGSYSLFLQYLKAKLENDPAVREHHRLFIEELRSRPDGKLPRFWKASLYMPPFLFEAAANIVLRQNRLKQWIARMRNIQMFLPTHSALKPKQN